MEEDHEERAAPRRRPPQEFRIALCINEACAALGIGRSSLYELIATGRIRSALVAGRRLIPVKELERLVDAGMHGSD